MTQENMPGQKRLPFGAAVKRGLCAVLLGLGAAGCDLADDPLITGDTGFCARLSRQNIDAVRQLYADFENATGSRIEVAENLGTVTKKEFDFHWGAMADLRSILNTNAAATSRMIRNMRSETSCNTDIEARMLSDYIFLILEYGDKFNKARMDHPETIKLRI